MSSWQFHSLPLVYTIHIYDNANSLSSQDNRHLFWLDESGTTHMCYVSDPHYFTDVTAESYTFMLRRSSNTIQYLTYILGMKAHHHAKALTWRADEPVLTWHWAQTRDEQPLQEHRLQQTAATRSKRKKKWMPSSNSHSRSQLNLNEESPLDIFVKNRDSNETQHWW